MKKKPKPKKHTEKQSIALAVKLARVIAKALSHKDAKPCCKSRRALKKAEDAQT